VDTKSPLSWAVVTSFLAFTLLCPFIAVAQCNLSQGCDPLDYYNYINSPTGQVFHGDGATNNGSGGWSTSNAADNQCLSCHYEKTTYLMTGHKNTLRKTPTGIYWNGPDNAAYSLVDSHYGSGSTFNWNTAQVTLGWCDPTSVRLQQGLGLLDSTCSFPYYTLPNAQAPAPYTPVAQTTQAGGVQPLFYMLGGWEFYGGTNNPSATQLDTVFSHGFTGQDYPNGNFDCARCHATGYQFNAWGPEPTQVVGTKMTGIPDAQLKRIPSDGYIAPGTNGTSSWYETGVQCERCHVAAWGYGSHPYGPPATQPLAEAATALCLECHREETINKNTNTINPGNGQTGSSCSYMLVSDHGYCSDLSSLNYSACSQNPTNTWSYKPSFDHEAGPTFLNSPHSRFSGTVTQNAQNSPDLSVNLNGTYQSLFTESPTDASKNDGCIGCHNPHQSTVSAVGSENAPNPMMAKCNDCHNLGANPTDFMKSQLHPVGPGTPFPTGTPDDIPGACVTCHMVAAAGTPLSHLFRINTASNYNTFPTASQFYTQGMTTPNTSADGTFVSAAWNDVDLACGQCHGGGTGNGNPYGLTSASPGAPVINRIDLAYYATGMHPTDPQVPTPQFSPAPGIYNTYPVVTISDSLQGTTIYYNTDGSTPPNSRSQLYEGASFTITSDTSFTVRALMQGYAASVIASGTYTLVAAPPTFSLASGTYATPQSVALSDISPGVTIYYTIDGSVPTTSSPVYSGPIALPIGSSKTTTIAAFAVGGGFSASTMASATYAFNLPIAAAPTLSPLGTGTFSSFPTITMSDSTPGATIYYTTDGSTPTASSTVYQTPITLTSSTTIKAIAVAYGYSSSAVVTQAYNLVAATPTLSPAPVGSFSSPQTVRISDTTAGVTIYYTTDNSTPTTSSNPYTGPITLTTSATVKAIAAGGGFTASPVVSGTYNLYAATPILSPLPIGTFNTRPTVTMSCATPGASIYYTTNGSTPNTSSTLYNGPFPVTTTETVYAIAVAPGLNTSSVAGGTYNLVAAQPSFSPLPIGTFSAPVSVTLKDTTPGVSVYYTTDGSMPTTSSTLYNGPIQLSATTTIKTIASGGGFSTSTVATGTYTFTTAADITPSLAESSVAANFILSSSVPLITTTSKGGTATFNIIAQPLNGFDQTLNFTCTSPAGTTCAISPTSLKMDGSSISSVEIAVAMKRPGNESRRYSEKSASLRLGGFLASILPFGLVGMSLVGDNRRLKIALVSVLIGCVLLMLSCGGGSDSLASVSSPSLSPGSYQVSVSAASTGTGVTKYTVTIPMIVK